MKSFLIQTLIICSSFHTTFTSIILGDSTTDAISTTQNVSGPLFDPLTSPVVPGTETYLEIDKGRSGLGLSIVGGADTLLVNIFYHLSIFMILNLFIYGKRYLFHI